MFYPSMKVGCMKKISNSTSLPYCQPHKKLFLIYLGLHKVGCSILLCMLISNRKQLHIPHALSFRCKRCPLALWLTIPIPNFRFLSLLLLWCSWIWGTCCVVVFLCNSIINKFWSLFASEVLGRLKSLDWIIKSILASISQRLPHSNTPWIS